jgi:hypothetical protein
MNSEKNGATRDGMQVKVEEMSKGKRVHGAAIELVREHLPILL